MQINFDAIPLFSSLSRLDRARLIPNCAVIAFEKGNAIVKQGEHGDSLFIIISGTAQVVRHKMDGSDAEIALLRQGECFGEVALLTGETRTADVIAIDEQTTVFRLSRERFNGLLKQHNALALKIASILAKRISRTNGHVTNNDHADVFHVTEPENDSETRELPSSSGLKAGWSLGVKLRSRRFISSALSVVLCSIVALMLSRTGMTYQQITLAVLLLGATVTWSFDAFSYHAVALALPLAAVVLNAAKPAQAFSGFSHPSWFLVLGVFAISAAISKTGLMYRLVLLVVSRFPASYRWQSFALALSGMFLTPIIPSSNGRAVLAGPLIANVSEVLRFRRGSAGSIGMSMAALLGFGHMSFMFMNGTATCLLAFGLLPQQVINRVTWGSWFLAALPLGLVFFGISYLAVLIQYRPKVQRTSGSSVIAKQLAALGPYSEHEQITILLVIASLLGFITQSFHHVNGAWIALTSFFLLFAFGVLPERSVRSDIDWNFLLSFGALVGFGGLISSSGLSGVMAEYVAPLLQQVKQCPYTFLVAVSLGMYLLRFFLPLPAAQLVTLLSVLPVLTTTNIDPFALCLVVLISGNPWFFPYQNSVYLNLLEATEGKVFDHHQTRKAAIVHVLAAQVAIIVSVPYWQWIGLIR
ncbi:anion permease [Trichlorobacter lovleyi]|uniref:SLC13 family permease n=1 Tax=Trichlorobacter lovleyi TaxID=313985 RepID=UPI00223FF09B|nr:SLC13 family permease [Trichlorobacter lovleyi]QOX78642.1 anion permease [Trichlorobacter lovleyi]